MDTQTAGGLAIPETSIVSNNRGEVVAVGPAVTNVQIGDVVLYSRWPGKAIKHDGEQLLVMPIGGVFAIVEDPPITEEEVASVLIRMADMAREMAGEAVCDA